MLVQVVACIAAWCFVANSEASESIRQAEALAADDECRGADDLQLLDKCGLSALQLRSAKGGPEAPIANASFDEPFLPENELGAQPILDPNGCEQAYGQCGGSGYTGKGCCPGGFVCTGDNKYWSSCAPASKDGPYVKYVQTAELQSPSNAPLLEFYVYRAKRADEAFFTGNVNVADLAGAMWYLHNEVVWMTPRKFDISRLQRFKLQTRASQPLADLGLNFGVRHAYDAAQCTGPFSCDLNYLKFGNVVGCNNLGSFPFPEYKIAYEGAIWYSLPGKCPSKNYKDKDAACEEDQPGGYCDGTPTGTSDCTYNIQEAGYISIDELEGIPDYEAFRKAGFQEYSKTTDKGIGLSFWNGINDPLANAARVARANELFMKKYPDLPGDEQLAAPPCDFNFNTFYYGTAASKTPAPPPALPPAPPPLPPAPPPTTIAPQPIGNSCAAYGCWGYSRGRSCQCNNKCYRYRNCCADFASKCHR
ncbi:unnamed protein product [Polarella glacialis]|uniref:Chitin-binding type-1 domain-containing protein n=1 Tax=Polarella glacialis TaxID=89957 RepID=A0A813J3B1_POLGL|nr:unnamed protein product [Polarella glacialis]CAE8666523.1 unnamed protein product [Polarella glacialis]